MRKSLILVPLSVMALAACSGNSGGSGSSGGIFGSSSGIIGSSSSGGSGSSGSSSGSSGGASATALSAFVLNLFSADTTETAPPTDLTTVMLDTSSEDPTAYVSLFASSSGG